MYKIPFKPIIGLLQIHFDRHVPLFPPFVVNGVDQLLCNYNIVQTSPAWNKCSLNWRDKFVKKRTNPSHNNLCNNLIHRVT